MNVYILEQQRTRELDGFVRVTSADKIMKIVMPYIKEVVPKDLLHDVMMSMQRYTEISKVVVRSSWNMYRQVIMYSDDMSSKLIVHDVRTEYDGNFTLIVGNPDQAVIEDWLNWKSNRLSFL